MSVKMHFTNCSRR